MTDEELKVKIEEHRRAGELVEFAISLINTNKTDDISKTVNELSPDEMSDLAKAYGKEVKRRAEENLKKAIDNCKDEAVASKIKGLLDKIEKRP